MIVKWKSHWSAGMSITCSEKLIWTGLLMESLWSLIIGLRCGNRIGWVRISLTQIKKVGDGSSQFGLDHVFGRTLLAFFRVLDHFRSGFRFLRAQVFSNFGSELGQVLSRLLLSSLGLGQVEFFLSYFILSQIRFRIIKIRTFFRNAFQPMSSLVFQLYSIQFNFSNDMDLIN
jgi:hypothetical protein